MCLFSFAVRLMRIAGEAFFFFELNRLFGRFASGTVAHRSRSIRVAERTILQHVGVPTRTVRVSLPSGVQIHTIVAGMAACDAHTHGEKPLVLLHGHSMAAASFFRNIDDFLQMGFTSVFIPDLPGWGSSSRPRFDGEHVDQALEFFLTPFHQWLAQLSVARFTLLGHSLGAYLAYEYALRHPVRVSSLLLTSPAAVARHTPVSLALWFAFTPQRFLTHGGLLAQLLFASKYPSSRAYNFPGFRHFTLCCNSVVHNSGDAAAATMLHIRRVGLFAWKSECVRPLLENVRRLQCAVHLITGDHDCLVQVSHVRALYRQLSAAGNVATMEVIHGADHSPHICAPKQFAKAVMRSFSRCTSYEFTSARQCVSMPQGHLVSPLRSPS